MRIVRDLCCEINHPVRLPVATCPLLQFYSLDPTLLTAANVLKMQSFNRGPLSSYHSRYYIIGRWTTTAKKPLDRAVVRW